MRRYRISRRCVCSDARDLRRFRAGTVKTMANAKVIVFNVEVEATATENKGTVLIESSDQLMNYNRQRRDRYGGGALNAFAARCSTAV